MSDLSTGCGVCFTNDVAYALGFSSGRLLIAEEGLIVGGREIADTRVQGYDMFAKIVLDAKFGSGNYDGYMLWAEIQKRDTILGSDPGRYTYVSRRTITQEDLAYDIIMKGDL